MDDVAFQLRRRGDKGPGRLWISPGARLWLATISCLLALATVFVVIPNTNERRASRLARATAAMQRAQSMKAGMELLHRFDCTYGKAAILGTAEAVRSYHKTAHIALLSRHAQLLAGNHKAANAALRSRRNAQRAESLYRSLLLRMKPLDGIGPCN